MLLLGRGEPVKAQTPYALLGEALRRCGGIARGAGRAEQQAALRRWVTATVAPQHVNQREALPQSFLRELEQSTACCARAGDRRFQVAVGTYIGQAYLALGRPEAALKALREFEQIAEQIEDEGPLSYVRTYLARHLALCGSDDALAEARQRGGDEAGARAVVARALAVLRRRVADVTDPDLRASYLGKVATNVRLLDLAAAHGLAPDLPG